MYIDRICSCSGILTWKWEVNNRRKPRKKKRKRQILELRPARYLTNKLYFRKGNVFCFELLSGKLKVSWQKKAASINAHKDRWIDWQWFRAIFNYNKCSLFISTRGSICWYAVAIFIIIFLLSSHQSVTWSRLSRSLHRRWHCWVF